jgi:hypothetical protein
MNSTDTIVMFARRNAVIYQCSVTCQFTGITCCGDAFDPAVVSVDASLVTAVLSKRG